MAYRARKEADGNYTIWDVPIFSTVPQGTKGAPYDIDKAWLDATVKKALVREGEGYMAPLNFEHHGTGEHVSKAAHYVPDRVGKHSVGGESKWTIFARLTKIPEPVFHQILAGDWPYRSVEIGDYDAQEIEHLSLLNHWSPFHKYELLNADSIRVDPVDEPQRALESAGAVAFARTDHGHVALYHYAADRAAPEGGTVFKLMYADGEATLVDADTGEVQPNFTVDASVHFASDEDEDKLPDDEKKLKKMAKAISAKLKKMQGEDDDDNPHTPAEPDKDKGMKGSTVEVTELLARFDSLEAKLKAKEEAEAASDAVSAELAGLKKDGYFVGEKTKTHFSEVASEYGVEALKKNVAQYRRTATKDGPDNLDDDDSGAEDEVLASFSSMGEDAYRLAVEADNHFAQLVAANWKKPEDRKGFIQRHLEQRGFKATG